MAAKIRPRLWEDKDRFRDSHRVAAQGYTPIALVGQTKTDVRDTIVEIGDSSIMRVAPPWFRPMYEPYKKRLTFPNGSICLIYSGDEPDQLRGSQHQKAWVDELAKEQLENNFKFSLWE